MKVQFTRKFCLLNRYFVRFVVVLFFGGFVVFGVLLFFFSGLWNQILIVRL